MDYGEFLKSKQSYAKSSGHSVELSALNVHSFEWQKYITRWALAKGKCALFEDCGAGKTLQQLDFAKNVCSHTDGNVLLLAPLAVSHQTIREGKKFGISATLCEKQSDVKKGINVTNYEKLHHFDPKAFTGIVLDESSILKSLSSKTRQTLIESFAETPYRLACTATPSPNETQEVGNHAEFLGIMTRSEMLSTFFVHDGGETQKWRLKGHAEDKFWEWIASWGLFLTSPADLGFDTTGYELPPLTIQEHIVSTSEFIAPDGQFLLLPQSSQTLNERRAARKNSLNERVAKAAEIANSTDEQCLVWCELNDEGIELTKAINGAVEIAGRHSDDYKVQTMLDFIDGKHRVLISKPKIAGHGCNLQNCRNVIYVGLSDSWEQYYQSMRRCWRYGQTKPVNVHIITSEAEGAVSDNIKRKQKQAQRMTAEMVKHTKEILKDDIRNTHKISETYIAVESINIPNWIRSETA
jgi:hypothetical protein